MLVVMLTVTGAAVGGCTDTALTSAPASANESAALQVTKTCEHNIFYNGLLPKAAAEAECVQCVVNALGQLGFRQTGGTTADALIADVNLTATQSSELSNACSQSDAAD